MMGLFRHTETSQKAVPILSYILKQLTASYCVFAQGQTGYALSDPHDVVTFQ